jgi:trans-aconitate methyltransferase
MVHADLREPATVLRHPEVRALIDLDQPVALMCAAVLHFVPDGDEPHRIIAEYRDQVAPGSYLAISHGTTGDTEDHHQVVGGVTSVYRQASAQLHVRSLAEIQRFFDGLEMIEPGLVWINEWRPDPGIPGAGQPRSLRGGVARKA